MPFAISPQALNELMQKQIVYLLDVRLPVEHAFVALPKSVLIPLQELPARWQEVKPGVNDKLVVYCHHGVRSWRAAAFLEEQGFTEVHSLEGGIDAWSCLIDPTLPRYA